MQDRAPIRHRKDVASRTPPNAIKIIRGSRGHRGPGASVIMMNYANPRHGKDIVPGTTPNTPENGRRSRGHRGPIAPVIMQNYTGLPHGKDIASRAPQIPLRVVVVPEAMGDQLLPL